MKKTTFGCICVYGFSLIAAILLLIFKSRISEDSYLIARILLFEYSVITGVLVIFPRYTIWLLKKFFKNVVADPDDYPEGPLYWWIIVVIVLLLDTLLKMTLIIPIAAIIQSSYILFKLIIVYKTLSLTDSQE